MAGAAEHKHDDGEEGTNQSVMNQTRRPEDGQGIAKVFDERRERSAWLQAPEDEEKEPRLKCRESAACRLMRDIEVPCRAKAASGNPSVCSLSFRPFPPRWGQPRAAFEGPSGDADPPPDGVEAGACRNQVARITFS